MRPVHHPECNATLTGELYTNVPSLPVRRVQFRGLHSYEGTWLVTSFWRLSWRERWQALIGLPIRVTLYGETHAPMLAHMNSLEGQMPPTGWARVTYAFKNLRVPPA